MIIQNTIGTTYLISIAVSEYTHILDSPNAVKDSDAIVGILTEKYKVKLHEKLDEEDVSGHKIDLSIKNLKGKITENDSLVIFYNGHGTVHNSGYYWPLKNSVTENKDSWFSVSELFNDLKEVEKLKHIVLFFNSCNSGNIFNQPYLIYQPLNIGDNMSRGKCRMVFASGLPDQPVDDSTLDSPKHSPFVGAILDILKEYDSHHGLSLSNIIYNTKEKLKQTNRFAKPIEGSYGTHGGREFNFYLKNDEAARWQQADGIGSIESYDTFIRFSARNSEYYNQAIKKRDELIEGRKALLSCIKDIHHRIKEFIDTKKNVELDDLNKAQELFASIDKIENDLTKQERSDLAWQRIKNSKVISDFENFEAEHPDSEYIPLSKSFRKDLKKNQEKEKDWLNIQKLRAPKYKRAHYAEFILKHKSGKKVDKAIKKIKDLDYWIDAIEEKDPLVKKEKLNKYLNEIEDGEYKPQANRLLTEAGIEAKAIELSKECNEYIATDNIDKIRYVKDCIEEIEEDKERELNEKTYLLANEAIEKYEAQKEAKYDEAIAKDSVQLITEFIEKYPETKESVELKDRLDAKDRDTFDCAMQSKDIKDFEYYLLEFGDYKGIFVDDAKEYIDELSLYHNLSKKEGYLKYLDDYPYGLMILEAREKIQEIEKEEHKKEQFDKIMNNPSIELCENYLHEFDEDDDMRTKVNDKLKQLEREQEKKDIYNKANNSEEEKRLGFCNEYIIRFSDGEDISEIKALKKKTEEDIEDNEAFAKAKIEGTMAAFEMYKKEHPEGLHITDADDFLLYLSIKNTEDISSHQKYLDEYPNGLNKNKVLDHISFLKAKIKKTIESFQMYIDENPDGIHVEDARKLQESILLGEKEEEFFQDAKKTDTIDGYWKYLRQNFPKKEANEKYAKKRMKELKELQEEKELYDKAIKEDNEETYIEYIKKHGTKGRFYPQVTRKLREKQTGVKEIEITDLSKNLADTNFLLKILIVFLVCAALYVSYKIQ